MTVPTAPYSSISGFTGRFPQFGALVLFFSICIPKCFFQQRTQTNLGVTQYPGSDHCIKQEIKT